MSRENKTSVVFFGTPEFALPSLEMLIKEGYDIKAVVTQPDKKVGRKQEVVFSPVKKLALENNLKVLQPASCKDPKFIQEIKKIKPGLIILTAFGQIIPNNVLEIPKHGALNLHASLLPRHRGASPIQAAILAGDKKTGITLIRMTEKLDAGPIIYQKEVKITEKETGATLHDKLKDLAASVVKEALPKWISGELKETPQNDKKASFCRTLKRDDGKIDFKKSAEEIERQIRAFNPWPSSFMPWQGKRLKIIKAEISSKDPKEKPGLLYKKDSQLFLATKNKSLLIKKLQLEGKKEISGKEFVRGYLK